MPIGSLNHILNWGKKSAQVFFSDFKILTPVWQPVLNIFGNEWYMVLSLPSDLFFKKQPIERFSEHFTH